MISTYKFGGVNEEFHFMNLILYKQCGGLFMDKGIIKMVIKVMIIAILLLSVSLYLAMHYGQLMMKSASTSSQTSQDDGTGISDSSSPKN